MESLAELERIQTVVILSTPQTQILQRIAIVELFHFPDSLPPSSAVAVSTQERLTSILQTNGVKDFISKRVPSDYYNWTYEARRDVLAAASIDHLCKSIVLVNTQAPADVTGCSNPEYSKYYVVVVQYTARFNAEAVKNFLYTRNNSRIPKKKFKFRLAPEDISNKLTGFEHSCVTVVGMKTAIPVIVDEAIVNLNPDLFWLGGGEVDLKLGITVSELIKYLKPFTVKCS